MPAGTGGNCEGRQDWSASFTESALPMFVSMPVLEAPPVVGACTTRSRVESSAWKMSTTLRCGFVERGRSAKSTLRRECARGFRVHSSIAESEASILVCQAIESAMVEPLGRWRCPPLRGSLFEMSSKGMSWTISESIHASPDQRRHSVLLDDQDRQDGSAAYQRDVYDGTLSP